MKKCKIFPSIIFCNFGTLNTRENVIKLAYEQICTSQFVFHRIATINIWHSPKFDEFNLVLFFIPNCSHKRNYFCSKEGDSLLSCRSALLIFPLILDLIRKKFREINLQAYIFLSFYDIHFNKIRDVTWHRLTH